jgi:hypothetical protein
MSPDPRVLCVHCVQADLAYLSKQMDIKRELDQLASVLKHKQELCRVTEANGADAKTFEETKRRSEEEVKRSEEEITKLTGEVRALPCVLQHRVAAMLGHQAPGISEVVLFSACRAPPAQIARLNRELEAARHARAGTSNGAGGDGSATKEMREKDKELRALKKRVTELQSAIQTAQRQQRQREREMKQVEQLHTEIEDYKRHKVRAALDAHVGPMGEKRLSLPLVRGLLAAAAPTRRWVRVAVPCDRDRCCWRSGCGRRPSSTRPRSRSEPGSTPRQPGGSASSSWSS